jgi:hypothetical protein
MGKAAVEIHSTLNRWLRCRKAFRASCSAKFELEIHPTLNFLEFGSFNFELSGIIAAQVTRPGSVRNRQTFRQSVFRPPQKQSLAEARCGPQTEQYVCIRRVCNIGASPGMPCGVASRGSNIPWPTPRSSRFRERTNRVAAGCKSRQSRTRSTSCRNPARLARAR